MHENEELRGWGESTTSRSLVHRVEGTAQLAELMVTAGGRGETVAFRGGGRSYGDAALNTGGAIVELGRLDRILEFDSTEGIARVEPGVTIAALWRMSIAHGFWPYVVPGTMHVTIGGALSMNIHGKNQYKVGSFGEYVRAFRLLTPSGEELRCSRTENADLFHAAIGGMGLLGCILEVELQLKRVSSGRLLVHARSTRDLGEAMQALDTSQADSDYMVGWIDCFARGSRLGRGLLHLAQHVPAEENPDPFLSPARQDVPGRAFGVVPLGWLWPGLWLTVHGRAMRWVNMAKFYAGIREASRPAYLQTHGAFHFLLDYVPGWKRALLPGGLLQFQPFVPKEQAHAVYTHILERCQREGLIPYLGVLKRHRPAPFLMSYYVDGYSLALDFSVTGSNRERLWKLCRELANHVLTHGGRFYYAKDSVLTAEQFRANHEPGAIEQFLALKARVDPKNVLQTDQWRRLTTPGQGSLLLARAG
jgi:decaprenylphospho-beta-D-ribofuranose 2-oxidase